MREITYNFITGLKELSKKYNFDGFFDVEISPTSFKLHSYYTEFYIHSDAEYFTATMLVSLRDNMKKLLMETKYPVNLEYAFSISSDDGTIHHLFGDSYEPSKENRKSNKIEFSCDSTKEEQGYTLSLDNGEIILERDHDDSKNYFKENPDIINFLNTFIDNKILNSTAHIRFTKEEYDTLTSIVFLAEESMLELAEKYPNPIELEQLKEQKQRIAEIVRKVRELTAK